MTRQRPTPRIYLPRQTLLPFACKVDFNSIPHIGNGKPMAIAGRLLAEAYWLKQPHFISFRLWNEQPIHWLELQSITLPTKDDLQRCVVSPPQQSISKGQE